MRHANFSSAWLLSIAVVLIASCNESSFTGNDDSDSDRKPDVVTTGGPGTDNLTPSTGTGSPGITDGGRDILDSGSIFSQFGQECVKDNPSGMTGRLYQLPTNIQALPNFAGLTPLGQIDAVRLDVPPREWDNGFPGVPNLKEWFAIEFLAAIKVPTTGVYEFKTKSDDGSKVYIDDTIVVTNDGIHSPLEASGSKQLIEGFHKLKVEWFQGPRNEIALQFFWKKPGSSAFEIVPTSVMTSAKDCNLDTVGQFP